MFVKILRDLFYIYKHALFPNLQSHTYSGKLGLLSAAAPKLDVLVCGLPTMVAF